MIRYNGVNHLALATGNMDETIRFWRDLLGMRLVAGLGHPGYRHYFFQIDERDMIAFFEWPDARPLPEKEHGLPVAGPFGFDHVSLGVAEEEDLWSIKDRLNAAGIWVSEVIDHGFIHSIYSFDPNGIPIEFSHAVEKFDLRREPLMTDRAPTELAKEGAEPHFSRWPAAASPTPRNERKVYPGAGSEYFHGKKKA